MIIRTKFNENVIKEMYKKDNILGIIALVISIIGIIVTIPLLFVEFSVILVMALVVFVILLVLGIFLCVTFKNTIKRFSRMVIENVYVFFDEYIDISSYNHNEIDGNPTKLYYSDIFKVKETKSYFFLHTNQGTAFPILKENIEDMSKFKSLIYKYKEGKK